VIDATVVVWRVVTVITDERYVERSSSRRWMWTRRVPSRVARLNKQNNIRAHVMIGMRLIVTMIGCENNDSLAAFADEGVVCDDDDDDDDDDVVVVVDVDDVDAMMPANKKVIHITAIVNGVMMMNTIIWIIAVMLIIIDKAE
jgi:hypothetical protein